MRRSFELLALASILTLVSLPAGAQEMAGRAITVEGQAEIRVVPDEVILTLGAAGGGTVPAAWPCRTSCRKAGACRPMPTRWSPDRFPSPRRST